MPNFSTHLPSIQYGLCRHSLPNCKLWQENRRMVLHNPILIHFYNLSVAQNTSVLSFLCVSFLSLSWSCFLSLKSLPSSFHLLLFLLLPFFLFLCIFPILSFFILVSYHLQFPSFLVFTSCPFIHCVPSYLPYLPNIPILPFTFLADRFGLADRFCPPIGFDRRQVLSADRFCPPTGFVRR